MKRLTSILMIAILAVLMTSCGMSGTESISSETDTLNNIAPAETEDKNMDHSDYTASRESDTGYETSGGSMKIRVRSDNYEVVFALNNTSAATSLYEQLPLTIEVENYSNNEKIFYPEKLDCSDVTEGACSAGTLAYFSPWGDVVMYYGSQSKYPGLYILGEAVEGVDNIKNFSGRIEITKVEN